MTAETAAHKPERVLAPRFWGKWSMLLLLIPIFIGVAIYRYVPRSSAKVTVWGQLSTRDVDAIRKEVSRWRHKDLGDALRQFRVGTVWDEVRLLRACPLESIVSTDGQIVRATCHGRIWNGNYRSITYTFTNNAGVWSGTERASSEGSR
jgi:hypothetical protein